MNTYVVFAYRGETWNDERERICISREIPTRRGAELHAEELKRTLKCKTEITERKLK